MPLKLTSWQIVTLLLGIFVSLVLFKLPQAVAGLTPIFRYLLFFDGIASLLALGVTLVAVVCVDKHNKMEAMFQTVAEHPRRLAATAFAISALGAWYAYQNHPLSMDEYAAHLQSQIFAAAQLAGHIPPALADLLIPKGFQGHFIYVNHGSGAITSAYWPGLALVMAPFTLAGVSWLCNPIITALTVLGLAQLLQKLVSDPAARGFGLLALVASPVILINGMSYYGMPLQLLCTVMFTVGVLKDSRYQMLAAGCWASLGVVAVNPVPVALYVLPWLVWIFITKPDRWQKLGWFVLGALPISLVLGLGWRLFVMGYVYNAPAAELGSDLTTMLNVFQVPSASLLLARGMALIKLWVWAVPGLLVLAVTACLQQKNKFTAVFAIAALVNWVAYLFVPFDQGHGWGYRYFHAAWLVLPVLAALSLQQMAAHPTLRRRAYGFAFIACSGSLALSLPLQASQVESFVSEHLQQIPERLKDERRQAVFVNLDCGFYASDLVQNAPFFPSKEIRLVSRGDELDASISALLGPSPRLVSTGPCGRRWLLD